MSRTPTSTSSPGQTPSSPAASPPAPAATVALAATGVHAPRRVPLARRIGTYATFLADMRQAARATRIPDGEYEGERPLVRLSLDDGANFAVALMQAWAMVGDVLTFYQERLANEGYLATAVEDQSVRELLRLIGYRPSTGVGATALVAFTAAETPGVDATLVVPAGTAILSIPAQGQMPQTFETGETLVIRSDWNGAAVPPVLAPPGLLRTKGPHGEALFEVRVKGATVGLSPGDTIVLLDAGAKPLASATRTLPASQAPCLASVTIASDKTYTALAWLAPPADQQAALTALGTDVQVIAFRQKAWLFGHNAVPWDTLPDLAKQQSGGTMIGGVARSTTAAGDTAGAGAGTSAESGAGTGPAAGAGAGAPAGTGVAAAVTVWTPRDAGLPLPALSAMAVRQIVSTSDGTLFAATASGVYRLDFWSATWMPASAGLTIVDVHTLLVDAQQRLYAGTSRGGVFRTIDRGEAWERLDGVVTVAYEKQDALGLKDAWVPVSTQLPPSVVRTLLVAEDTVFAGTDSGVFESATSGGGWKPLNRGLPGATAATREMASVSIASLAMGTPPPPSPPPASIAHGGGEGGRGGEGVAARAAYPLVAATDQGLFVLNDAAGTWTPANTGLPGATPQQPLKAAVPQLVARPAATAAGRAAALWCVGPGGIYRSPTGTLAWQPMNAGLPTAPIDALVWDARGDRLICAAGGALYRFDDAGARWVAIEGAPANVTVVAAAAGEVVVVSPFAGWVEQDWPGLVVQPPAIDLDTEYPRVIPDSWLLVSDPATPPPTPPPTLTLCPVSRTAALAREDFWLRSRLTRVTTTGAADDVARVGQVSIRQATVLVQSERLEQVLEPQPVTTAPPPGSAPLQPDWDEHPPAGRTVLVTGVGNDDAPRPRRLQLAALTADGRGVMTPHPSRYGPRQEGPRGAAFGPTHPFGVMRFGGPGATLFTGSPPPIQPGTLQAHANVVLATQGETVRNERLGSGDAMQAHQMFVLKRGPLIFVHGAAGARRSTLRIDVNGARWDEVTSFYESGPDSRHYVTHLAASGKTSITFGDGERGARLPTGTDNVRATYRIGDPNQGIINPGNLANIRNRPLGVRAATTFHVSNVAEPPEPTAEAAGCGPLRTRALDRVVSLQDFADLTLVQRGVRTARAQLVWSESFRVPVVTLDTDGDRGPSPGELRAFAQLLQARSAYDTAPVLCAADVVLVSLRATLFAAPGADVGALAPSAASAIAARFGRAARQIGDDLTLAAIVATLQRVPDVAGVHVDLLKRLGDAAQVSEVLRAAPARWTAGCWRGAELLAIDLLAPAADMFLVKA